MDRPLFAFTVSERGVLERTVAIRDVFGRDKYPLLSLRDLVDRLDAVGIAQLDEPVKSLRYFLGEVFSVFSLEGQEAWFSRYVRLKQPGDHVDSVRCLFFGVLHALSTENCVTAEHSHQEICLRYLTRAMRFGNSSAETFMADCYYNGLYGFERDDKLALYYATTAFESGNPRAAVLLGEHALELASESSKSSTMNSRYEDFLRRAVEMGYYGAARELGSSRMPPAYLDAGTYRDVLRYHGIAASYGDTDPSLGALHSKWSPIYSYPYDLGKACAYYIDAAMEGNADAVEALKVFPYGSLTAADRGKLGMYLAEYTQEFEGRDAVEEQCKQSLALARRALEAAQKGTEDRFVS